MKKIELNLIGHKGILFIDATANNNKTEKTRKQTNKTLEDFTPALLNNPLKEGQLGFVCDAKQLYANKEAIELLEKCKIGGNVIGDIDCYSSDDKVIFSWLGGPLRVYKNTSIIEGSRNFNKDSLKFINVVDVLEADIPKSILEYV